MSVLGAEIALLWFYQLPLSNLPNLETTNPCGGPPLCGRRPSASRLCAAFRHPAAGQVHPLVPPPWGPLKGPPSPLKLQDVVKLPLLQRLPRGRVEEVWKAHLLSKPHLHAATIDGPQHELLSTNARHTPTFILPLPRGPAAFEILFAQFQRTCCLVTSLEQYKQNPTSAAPLFLLIFYAELQQSHDLVLVKGDSLSPAVGPREAQHLTQTLLASYTDANKYEWVARFNLAPNTFDFEAFKEANPDFFRFPLPERQPYTMRQTPENEFNKTWIP
ncbi:hypothetical protein Esti_003262 [Eimeria stiedai]